MGIFDRRPPIGTPENPEIIEPGQTPRSGSSFASSNFGLMSRFAMAVQMLGWMAVISIPAFLLDYLCIWLLGVAQAPGGWPAWILLFLLAPPTFLFNVIAFVGNILFLIAILLAFTGTRTTPRPLRMFVNFNR